MLCFVSSTAHQSRKGASGLFEKQDLVVFLLLNRIPQLRASCKKKINLAQNS